MTGRPTTIERAFELARSGQFTDVAEIKERLVREDYFNVVGQISGPALIKQLKELCAGRARRK